MSLNSKYEKKLKDLAEYAEEKYQDVLALFIAVKEMVKKKFDYELSEAKLNKQAYEAVAEHYNSERFKQAKEMLFIPFGIFSEAKDKNEELRNEILKEWSEPQNQIDMIKAGKVMVMKVSDKKIDEENVKFTDVFKPVKNRDSIKTTKVNDEVVVIEGDLWKPGDKPIPRDYRRKIIYGEGDEDSYDNFQYSKPLDPNWRVSLIGIGFFAGTKDKKVQDPDTGDIDIIKAPKDLPNDGVLCKVSWTGDYADPSTPSFICKKPIWFEPCKLKAIENSMSNELIINSTARTDVDIIAGQKIDIVKVIKHINGRVEHSVKKVVELLESEKAEKIPKDKLSKLREFYEVGKKYLDKDYIPIIDLIGVNEYHMTHKAIINTETGRPLKQGAWDRTDFDSIAICQCSYSGIYSAEGKAPKMIITDASLPQEQSLFLKFSKGVRSDLPKSSVILSLTTSRGNQIYDVDTKTWIVNEEEAQAVAKIKGIKMLYNFETLDIESIKRDLQRKNLKADV